MKLADKAEAERRVLCKHYEGKALYAGLHHLYAEVHREMKTLLLEHANSNVEFREQKRRGRPQILRQNIKQASKQTTGVGDTPEIPTRNFFAPLWSAGMELDQTEDTNNQTDGEKEQ
jgi:hypothetical protein